jgi:DNA-binding CsgD family transcriptional regulator
MTRTTTSPREQEIAALLEAGRSPQQAADVLGIELSTLNTHRHKAARRRGGPRPLPKRQREVVSCLALGLTIDEVAEHLGISRRTAVNHRTLAGLTTGARSVVMLTHYAIVQGWVQAGDALSADRVDAALQIIARDAASP